MKKSKIFYKRLLDITLFSSFGLFVLFVFALMFAMIVNAFQFTNPYATQMFREDFEYLCVLITFLGFASLLFMILSRVFFGFIQSEERLQTAASYRKRQKKVATGKNTGISFSQSEAYQMIKNKAKNKPVEEETHIDASEAIKNEATKNKEKTKVKEVVVQEETPVVEEVIVPTQAKETPKTPAKDKEYYSRLNKDELIKLVAKATGLSQVKVRKFMKAFLDLSKEQLASHQEVKLDNFGRFHTKFMKESTGVNPQTGRKITIKEHHEVKFTPYKDFKDKITNEVRDTSGKYLRTKTVEKKMTEDQLSDSLQSEKVAAEHVTMKTKEEVKPSRPKKKKVVVPKKTKADVIEYINNSTDLSKNKANKFLKAFAEVVKDELVEKRPITIKGFGKFETLDIPQKEGVNPSTREKIIVEAHTQVRLRFEKVFRDKMN